jgi:hypothetical protein
MFTRTKKLFQLSFITLVAAILFLGTMGVNTALADHDTFDMKFNIKVECHNGTDKPTKSKIKSTGTFRYDPNNTNLKGTGGGNSPFPNWNTVDIFIIDDFDGVGVPESFQSIVEEGLSGVGLAGTALTKNGKKGTFQTFVDNDLGTGIGSRVLSLSGKIVADKENGDGLKVVGKIYGHDTANDCIYVGKFKGKRP